MPQITVSQSISAPIEKVWEFWTSPKHIQEWNSASPDWHTPHAENDLQVGGVFCSRMESKDGTQGFDFKGTYTALSPLEKIEYELEDKRKVSVSFEQVGEQTLVTETFDPESENTLELQRQGWNAILEHFKAYVESH